MKRLLLLLAVCMTCISSVWAQSQTIMGKVVDASTGEPVIGASVVVQGKDEETGIEYDVILYTIDSEGYVSYDDLILAYNADGTITTHETSKVVGVTALAQNPNDEEDYFFMDNGTISITLNPIELPASMHKKIASKKEILKQTSTITPRKKFAFTHK